ncbi:hypothetical protein VTJ49DRAFT_5391 [Mycothermus thermophilus]|uniref:F-box domain-containing protein n=1 Tax=Humicola insolens TaxID=85995 RepID=A0ABR3V3S6_HUMIN
MAPGTSSLLRKFLGRQPRGLKVQRMRPRCPDQPSLAALNDDILILIAHWVYEIDPESLNSLALVCSALYRHVRRVQYRSCCIDLGAVRHEDNLADSKRLESLARNEFLSAVRTLRICVSDKTERAIHEGLSPSTKTLHHYDRARLRVELPVWRRLGELIPQMTGLRDLHWHGHVLPDAVREHLRTNPDLRLHLSLFATTHHYWPPQQARLENLSAHFGAAAASLTSLRIKIEYGEAQSCRPITRALKEVLLNSPRLRTLSINIGHPRKGCVGRGAEPEYCGFGFAGGETLAPLEELEVIAYPWGQTRMWFNTEGYPDPEAGTEMEYWARNFDWSRLRRLKLHDLSAPLTRLLAPRLVTLKEVYLDYACGVGFIDEAVRDFFRTLAPSARLRAATLPWMPPNDPAVLDALISGHSSTLNMFSVTRIPPEASVLSRVREEFTCLKEITIRCDREAWVPQSSELEEEEEEEAGTGAETAPAATSEEEGGVDAITPTTPATSQQPMSSATDVNNKTVWSSHVLTTLTTLTSLQSLRALTVYFPNGEPCDLHMPTLSYSSARDLAEALYSVSAATHGNNTPFPRELRLYSGHLEDFLPDYPVQYEWSRDNSTGFVCRRRKVGGAGEAAFEINCLKLNRQQNERLRAVVEGGAAMTEEEERCVDFLVACRGAMDSDTYLAWRQKIEAEGRRRQSDG